MILEALRCGYPWASDRLHRFVMEGMKDNAAGLRKPESSTIPIWNHPQAPARAF